MGKLANLTSHDIYFEDFEVGQTIRHACGKTMTSLENVNITTIHGHEHGAKSFSRRPNVKNPNGKILCYGGVNFSLVLGLASQDIVEHALAGIGLHNISLKTMVIHDDTLCTYPKVLEKRDCDQEGAGIKDKAAGSTKKNQENIS